jgi:hypothetical protein
MARLSWRSISVVRHAADPCEQQAHQQGVRVAYYVMPKGEVVMTPLPLLVQAWIVVLWRCP